MTKVFGDYDQAGLDGEYDNRAKVPEALDFMRKYAAQSAAARRAMAGRLDVPFGPGSEEVLDIFPAPEGSAAPAPIQVFIHGGYWKMLSKDDFSYVAGAFAPLGCATVVVNYGLIPAIDMDELVRQCRAALAWIYRNAAAFGGDGEHIFISGHSAGGHLVAMMMATDWPRFDDRTPALPKNLIKGGCGISGLYDLEPIRLCFLNDDLGLSRAEAGRNSPLRLAPSGPGPLLLTLGGAEGPEYLRQSEDLAAAWRRHGLEVEVKVLPGQNHFTIIDQLGDPEAELSRLILAQMGL
jgi:arylformamidase